MMPCIMQLVWLTVFDMIALRLFHSTSMGSIVQSFMITTYCSPTAPTRTFVRPETCGTYLLDTTYRMDSTPD
ncbi:hypothetical protein F5Y15DRAFT_385574 [Xylariaceae sp. FL0016]|nr:hypothetical protein F5Y15DRAFT_385574 [Xylariaceae sp. FL0016]